MASILTFTLNNSEKIQGTINQMISTQDAKYLKLGENEEQMQTMLKSNSDSDIILALKTILFVNFDEIFSLSTFPVFLQIANSMMREGKDIQSYYPLVLNIIIKDNAEIKQLSYLTLLQAFKMTHSEAFLTVNKFQKDLTVYDVTDKAIGLKMLSYITIPEIKSMVLHSIGISSNSNNVYLRFVALIALYKLLTIDGEKQSMFEDYGEKIIAIYKNFLSDSHWLIFGPAVSFILKLVPTRLDLIHPIYFKLCDNLQIIDDFYFPDVCAVLTNYCKVYLVKNISEKNQISEKEEKTSNPFMEEEQKKSLPQEVIFNSQPERSEDLDYLLNKCKEMIEVLSNSSTILSLCSLLYHILSENSPSELQILEKPLMRILRKNDNSKHICLSEIIKILETNNSLFKSYLRYFKLKQEENLNSQKKKLQIMCLLSDSSNIKFIQKELQFWIHVGSNKLACECIAAIGQMALKDKFINLECVRSLILLLKSSNQHIVAETVISLRKLILQSGENNAAVVLYCLKMIDNVKTSGGRCSIIWLLGEYHHIFPTISQDALRKFTIGFTSESTNTKLQILNLGIKLYNSHIENENSQKFSKILAHLFNLASYDLSYVVREKVRIFKSLLENSDPQNETELQIRKSFLKHLQSSQLSKPISESSEKIESESKVKEEEDKPAWERHRKENTHLHALSFIVHNPLFIIQSSLSCEKKKGCNIKDGFRIAEERESTDTHELRQLIKKETLGGRNEHYSYAPPIEGKGLNGSGREAEKKETVVDDLEAFFSEAKDTDVQHQQINQIHSDIQLYYDQQKEDNPHNHHHQDQDQHQDEDEDEYEYFYE